ncbi:MAG: ECF transporter S component [Clostridia bacterium]|nr:ECF transporter S component [Clostridia bacterium]
MNNKKVNVRALCAVAMFTALSIVAAWATKWLTVAHLTFDAKDAVITIAAYIYGPLSGVAISLVSATIETLTMGGGTGWYGFMMDFLSSASFSVIASAIYMKKRDINGALLGLGGAIVGNVGIMLLVNTFVTPLYLGLPLFHPAVMDMLPTLVLPFNLAKGLMNSAIAMFAYKPVAIALRRAKLAEGAGFGKLTFNRNSVLILIFGGIGVILSVALFLILIYMW